MAHAGLLLWDIINALAVHFAVQGQVLLGGSESI